MRVLAAAMGRVVAIALALNWVWEAVHAVAYAESQGTFAERLRHCLPMAATDAAWTAGLWAISGGLWPSAPRWSPAHLALLAGLGATTAVLLERVALVTGRWTYNGLMPVLPVLDVGLWPVLQMTVLPVVAVRLAEWDARRKRGRL